MLVIVTVTMDEDTTSRLDSHQSTASGERWIVLGKHMPKSEIVFLCQTLVIFTVVISAIINISLGNSSETWLVLLSTSVGAVLPNPKLKSMSKKVVTNQPAYHIGGVQGV